MPEWKESPPMVLNSWWTDEADDLPVYCCIEYGLFGFRWHIEAYGVTFHEGVADSLEAAQAAATPLYEVVRAENLLELAQQSPPCRPSHRLR